MHNAAIAIVGATASGKTATSLELASLLLACGVRAEIISADSRQLYRYLTIGTAKPSSQELSLVPHHFIDCRNPDEICSAGEFGVEASRIVGEILQRGNLPLIVGGSGLYVRALTDGMFDEAEIFHEERRQTKKIHSQSQAEYQEEYQVKRAAMRAHLQKRLDEEGVDVLYAELATIDKVSAAKYSDRNPRRILRALEYYHTSGVALSEAHRMAQQSRSFSTIKFGIEVERGELYRRINRRAESMFREGILEETAAVLAMGYAPTLNALNTVGYKESVACLRGDMSRERALECTAQNSRRYAKRQLTWFRRDERIQWCAGSPEEIATHIYASMYQKQT